jgi:hypothetical protein
MFEDLHGKKDVPAFVIIAENALAIAAAVGIIALLVR